MSRKFSVYIRTITLLILLFSFIIIIQIIIFIYNEPSEELDRIEIISNSLNTSFINNNNTLKFPHAPIPDDLPKPYRLCITQMIFNITCHLPFNTSFKIINELGRGAVAIVYSVQFNNGKYYAMKFNYGSTTAVRGEYNFLYKLKLYTIYNNISLNIPWLHPLYPPYFYLKQDAKNERRKFRCFIFIEQLTNAISWDEMELKHKIYNEIINTHNNILNFLLNGYNDIMFIFHKTNELSLYHNDFHE
eukprot:307250_1